jgi:hypothetical protein
MTGLTFPWIFIGLAAAVDVVGLFYLWGRRSSGVGTNPRTVRRGNRPLRIPLAERRRGERRGNGKATALQHLNSRA